MRLLPVLVACAVVALLGVWMYRRLIVATDVQSRWKYAVALAIASLTGLALVVLSDRLRWGSADDTRGIASVAMTWLVVALYLSLGLVAGQVISGVARVSVSRERRTDVRRVIARTTAAVSVVTALCLTAYGIHQAARPSITPFTLTSATLPASFDRLKIALVTDLHSGAVRGTDFTRDVVRTVNAAQPDVVMLSGDVVDADFARHRDQLAPLADLDAPMGTFAVTGNHEMYVEAPEWIAQWRRLGVTVLANESHNLTRGSERIVVAGVHDLQGSGDLAPDPQRALAQADADDFTVLMAHQPRMALRLPRGGVDLMVSGHTHGGQVWPMNFLVPLQQPVVEGFALINKVPVFTSRGVGTWGPPVRVGAPPEIPLITVRASS